MTNPSLQLTPRRVRSALLGFVAVGLFAGAVVLTWFFLHGGLEGGLQVDAVFSKPGVGQQLPTNGDVKIRGVLVGRIADMSLDDEGNAVVELRLQDDLGLPANTRAEIRSKTVFGQKWVELIPPAAGEGEGDLIAAGVIPDPQTKEPLEFEQALQLGHDLLSEIPLGDLSVVLEELAGGFSGSEADAARAIDRGLIALRAVNSRSDELDLGLRQLRTFAEWLDQNDEDLVSFMESVDASNRALVGAAPEFRSSMRSVPIFLEDLARFQELIEDDLGTLVEEGATVAEIVAARSDQLTDIIVELEPFTTVWNSGLKQPCAGPYESDMTCWQIYQSNGLDSRGLYRGNEGPQSDDPGDPGAPRTIVTEATFADLLAAKVGRPVPSELAQMLYAPALEALPELLTGESP